MTAMRESGARPHGGAHGGAWIASTPKRVSPGRDVGGLRSVGTALDVLECFATDSALGVSDIARRVGVAKSTAHRVLTTLASRGFIEQDEETGLYSLGLHLYELGTLSLARNQLRHAALPTLRMMAHQTGLTVNLGVADGADVVFIERIEAQDSVRFLGHSGRRLPAHTTSSGKAIAAFDEQLDQERRIAGFPPRARETIRREEDWDAELRWVRSNGHARTRDASYDGSASVAVPIRHQGAVLGSVSFFGPGEVINPRIGKLLPMLVAGAARISRDYRA
ncbi:IclR family transcriptional regulator [Janibacter corallicola]|uniref:IclR family transcriptional regulator n=1 Tax=Janibacter corallicola TaxID=415212 RepID=UPI00083291DE|nr:IclR family transcriptional regulator [Janibacter corallicola]